MADVYKYLGLIEEEKRSEKFMPWSFDGKEKKLKLSQNYSLGQKKLIDPYL